MPSVNDVSTPPSLIDVEVLERNIARMAERARAAGVRLRPHGKTHKLLESAACSSARARGGLSLAKTSEAEVFAAAGFDDIFVAYPVVGADKGRRLLALAEKIRLAVGVDSVDGARTLGDVFAAAGRRLDVRLKIDSGLHRVGVLPEQASGGPRHRGSARAFSSPASSRTAGHAYGETEPQASPPWATTRGHDVRGRGSAAARGARRSRRSRSAPRRPRATP
jgi:D-serine deaminase-like pyridoxal phosphate-dependent protein